MLREASDSLFEHLISAFPPDRPYSLSAIEQDPMPPLLAHFLIHSLQHKLDNEVEHLRTIRSHWFNYDHPDVQQTYKAFISALAKQSHIPQEEWRATLKRATKLVIAHLVLPTHTLVEYIFHDGEGPLQAPFIYRQLAYFAAYPYLREAVEAFMKQRQLQELERSRFASLLMQIDKHMTANYAPNEWIRMLKPMFDLMRRVPYTQRQGAPIELLTMFFGDKDAYEIQERLSVEKEVRRSSVLNEDALRKVIEGSVEPFTQQLIPAAAKTTPAAPPSPEVDNTPPPAVAAETKKAEVKKAETKKEIAEPPPPVPQPQESLKADIAKPVPEKQPVDANPAASPRPLWKQFQKQPQPAEPIAQTNGSPTAPQQEAPSPKPGIPLWMQFQKGPENPPVEPEKVVIATPKAPQPPPPETVEARAPQPAVTSPEPVPMAPPEPIAPSPASPPMPEPPQQPAPIKSPPQPVESPEILGALADEAPTTPAPEPRPMREPETLEQLEFSVLGLYGSSNRALFIENLFNGSAQAYQQLLKQLHTTESWSQASALIADEVFKKNNVNIYSPAAIMFTESVEEQYKIV